MNLQHQKEYNYWNKRYKNRGTSGQGSIGELREWKWKIINKYLNRIDSVIDVGCGDRFFWENIWIEHYIGIDISPIIIKRNKIQNPNLIFLCASSSKNLNIKLDNVFCFDVLFHIMGEKEFIKTLKNLIKYANKYIFIYTWEKNPFDQKGIKIRLILKALKYSNFSSIFSILISKKIETDYVYQTYRNLSKYKKLFSKNNFKLINIERTKNNSYGAMYIFKKSE